MKERLSGKLLKELELEIPDDWQKIIDYFASRKKFRTLIIGGLDAGKSTLSFLIQSTLNNVYVLEADPGQSSYLIPGVFSLVDKTGKVEAAYFIGDISPAKNLSGVLHGIFLLARKAEGANIVVDTSGYISGDLALELKLAKASLVKADHAVLIEKEKGELEKFEYHLKLRGLTVLKCAVSTASKNYSSEERRKRREIILKTYFEGAEEDLIEVEKKAIINLQENEMRPNTVFAFENEKGICEALGLVKEIIAEDHRYMIKYLAKEKPRRIVRIKLGRIWL
mgnify:CR=1 FL=1